MNTQLPDNGEVSGAIYRPVICPGVRGATPGSIPRWRLYRTSTHRRLSGHRFGRYSSRSQSFAFFSIAVTLPYPSVFVNPKFCSFLGTFGSLTYHNVGSIIIATGRGSRKRAPPQTASLVQLPRPCPEKAKTWLPSAKGSPWQSTADLRIKAIFCTAWPGRRSSWRSSYRPCCGSRRRKREAVNRRPSRLLRGQPG